MATVFKRHPVSLSFWFGSFDNSIYIDITKDKWQAIGVKANNLLKFTEGGMKVKVVGIYGSPRKGSNSDLLLDSALRGDYEKGIGVGRIYARDLEISSCMECGACEKSGTCVVGDDIRMSIISWIEQM